ncbi:hypothetical protein Tco_0054558 [Tanacetum coccineum]
MEKKSIHIIIEKRDEIGRDLVKEITGEDISEADYAQRMIKKLTDEELKEKFEYLMRSMERFVPMDTEKESRKRTGVELQTESSKKLKSDTREDVSVPKEKDKESVKREEEFEIKKPVLRYTKRKSLARKGLQKKPESAKSGTEEDVEAYMEERVDEPSSEEFPMSSIPQGPAPAKIVKWQIIKTGKRGAYQIIREDNTDVVYVNFQGLLNDLTRDDLKELYRLMMLKYGDNRPEEEFERVLWGDLKTMFDPPSEEDAIWKLPHQQQILNWRYFHSCSVHCLTVEAAHIYMLTEVKYPLPPRVCKAMLEKKLLGDRKDESTMSNRHKDWLVQEQTALGKDFSNPFMADNLPKIVWLSTHHIYVCKELASPQGYGLWLLEAGSDEEYILLYDEHFNAQEYWLSISRKENLGLSRSHTSTIRNPILRVIHKMITYGLCQRATGYDKMKRKGASTQKESQICYGQFISKIARKYRVLTEDVVRSLSALIYCRDLDKITLTDLIDSRRAYNPPGYAQPQYDQYYQQYPPPPLQYQQLQDNDE